MNEYIKQANEFLAKANATIKIEFSGLAVNRQWKEKEKRCFYDVTITTPHGSMNFDFWDSIHNTEIQQMTLEQWARKHHLDVYYYRDKVQAQKQLKAAKEEAKPTAYDVLACLTKYDPGTFEDFCSDFGYDEDSRTAEQIYFAVVKEYKRLSRIFTAEQMEELQEIN